MKLLLKKNESVIIAKTGREISASALEAQPRLHCKVYSSLWRYFEVSDAEKQAIEKMSIEDAKQADFKDLKEKEAQFLASLESQKEQPKTKKELSKEPKEENGSPTT